MSQTRKTYFSVLQLKIKYNNYNKFINKLFKKYNQLRKRKYY